MVILLLPWDIANREYDSNGEWLTIMWQALFIIALILIIVVIPFTINFYTAEEFGKG